MHAAGERKGSCLICLVATKHAPAALAGESSAPSAAGDGQFTEARVFLPNDPAPPPNARDSPAATAARSHSNLEVLKKPGDARPVTAANSYASIPEGQQLAPSGTIQSIESWELGVPGFHVQNGRLVRLCGPLGLRQVGSCPRARCKPLSTGW